MPQGVHALRVKSGVVTFNDEQTAHLLLSRTEGELRAAIQAKIMQKVPLSAIFSELQLFFGKENSSKVVAERAAMEFNDIKNGIRLASQRLLELCRNYGSFISNRTKYFW